MPRRLTFLGVIALVSIMATFGTAANASALCDTLPPTDTLIFIDINDSIATPGMVVPISVFIQNTTDSIQAFQMSITLSRNDLLYFDQDTVIDTCFVCVDSACTIIDTALCTLAVSGFDTVGALIDDWEYVEARTFTSSDIRLTGISDLDFDGFPPPISPFVNGLLITIVGKTYCDIPDSLTDRTVTLTANQIGTYFSDTEGCLIELSKLTTGSLTVLQPLKGDFNGDFTLNVLDVVFLIDYVFRFGNPPCPVSTGELNCDPAVNVLDVVYIIDHVFRFGPPPIDPCP